MKKPLKHLKQIFLFLGNNSIGLKTKMTFRYKHIDLSNEEIFKGIKEEDPGVFKYIEYRSFPTIINLAKQFKGHQYDANELFQDALIVVFRKLEKGNIVLTCKFNTYFIGICKTILKYNYNKKKIYTVELVHEVEDEQEIQDLYKESKEFQLYRKHFNSLKNKQKKLLSASLSNKPYRDLFEDFGYRSADVLKTEIYRAKRKLIDKITADPEFKKINGGKNWSL